jgi:hypothetical protein
MLLKSSNAMPLILYFIHLLLIKAILLAIIKIVYSFKFSLFIVLKISLIRAIIKWLNSRQ